MSAPFVPVAPPIAPISPPFWMRGRFISGMSLLILLVFIVTACAYWQLEGDRAKRIDFVTRTLFASGAAVAVLVGYQTLRLNIYKDQIRGAFEFLSRFDRPDERACRRMIDDLMKRIEKLNLASPPDAARFIAIATEAEQDAARSVISFAEDLALAIRCGYAHEPAVFRSLDPVMRMYISQLQPYVEHVRALENEPLYYEDAMQLLQRWSQKQSLQG